MHAESYLNINAFIEEHVCLRSLDSRPVNRTRVFIVKAVPRTQTPPRPSRYVAVCDEMPRTKCAVVNDYTC